MKRAVAEGNGMAARGGGGRGGALQLCVFSSSFVDPQTFARISFAFLLTSRYKNGYAALLSSVLARSSDSGGDECEGSGASWRSACCWASRARLVPMSKPI